MRRNECGVQLRLNRQLWKRTRQGGMSPQAPSMTRQLARYFRSESEWREGAKLTNGTEVKEEWQFSAAGQAGVGLAQLVEESVRTCLQRRQPCHWCVFQQAGAESDGLRWCTRLKHLTSQWDKRGKSMLSGTFRSMHSKCSVLQTLNSCSFVCCFFTKCQF